MVLKESVVREILRLFKGRISRESIAKRLNISRQLVAIYVEQEKKRKRLEEKRRWQPLVESPNRQATPIYCERCGTNVFPPCLACQVRDIQERRRLMK